jgi:hypothetical protein
MVRGEYHAKMILRSKILDYLESETFRVKVLERRGRYASFVPQECELKLENEGGRSRIHQRPPE